MEQQQSQLYLDQVSLTTPVSSYNLLKDISFTVEKGARVALVGTSGAGKTSLLRLFNRLISPTSGYIYFDERDREIRLQEIQSSHIFFYFTIHL